MKLILQQSSINIFLSTISSPRTPCHLYCYLTFVLLVQPLCTVPRVALKNRGNYALYSAPLVSASQYHPISLICSAIVNNHYRVLIITIITQLLQGWPQITQLAPYFLHLSPTSLSNFLNNTPFFGQICHLSIPFTLFHLFPNFFPNICLPICFQLLLSFYE